MGLRNKEFYKNIIKFMEAIEMPRSGQHEDSGHIVQSENNFDS